METENHNYIIPENKGCELDSILACDDVEVLFEVFKITDDGVEFITPGFVSSIMDNELVLGAVFTKKKEDTYLYKFTIKVSDIIIYTDTLKICGYETCKSIKYVFNTTLVNLLLLAVNSVSLHAELSKNIPDDKHDPNLYANVIKHMTMSGAHVIKQY